MENKIVKIRDEIERNIIFDGLVLFDRFGLAFLRCRQAV
jgi:hypothetical protein